LASDFARGTGAEAEWAETWDFWEKCFDYIEGLANPPFSMLNALRATIKATTDSFVNSIQSKSNSLKPTL
jgi:hypothetical protein